MKSPLSI